MKHYLFPKNKSVNLSKSTCFFTDRSAEFQKLEKFLFHPMIKNLIQCREICKEIGAINAFSSLVKPVLFNDPFLAEYMIVGPIDSFLFKDHDSIPSYFEIVQQNDNGIVCKPSFIAENSILLQIMYDVPSVKLSSMLSFLGAADQTGSIKNLIDIKVCDTGLLFASPQLLMNPNLLQVTQQEYRRLGGDHELSEAFEFTHNYLSHERNTVQRTA